MPPVSGENTFDRLTPDAIVQLHEAIVDAGGHEVFFAGTLGADGKVERVRVLARGHASAVPAIFEGLDIREVVIHNHPGDDLTPSEPDLQLAAMYSNHGHGMFIIDNEASQVYVVVEPFVPKQAALLNIRELEAAFRPDGPMAKNLPAFEVRPQQAQMMEAIAEAFNTDSFAVVEAPTGVGKTVAYLIPAVLWAIRNKERIVVSTRTINLQEQIIEKDLPLLKRCLDVSFEACLVKGRGNYLCLRKLERALAEVDLFQDEAARNRLTAIADWVNRTEDGSLSDLPFVPGRELWDKVNSEADTCSGGRCPNQQKCFVGKARRAMARADILVTNHHMFFSDMAVKREANDFSAMAVLPVFHRVILDEAHSIEDSATEYLGVSATRSASQHLFNRFLRSEGGRERGFLTMLKNRLMKECPQLSPDEYEQLLGIIEDNLMPALTAARTTTEAAFEALRALTGERCGQVGRDIKWRLTQEVLDTTEIRELHRDYMMPATENLRSLMRACEELHRRLRQVPPAPGTAEAAIAADAVELRAYADRIKSLGGVLSECTSQELAENTVRWVEIDARNPQFARMVRCPLEVGEPLAESIYGQLKTVVMTSATLTVQQKFDYLFKRLGLDRVPAGRVRSVILDSPFDYPTQAMLCIPSDGVDPTDRTFFDLSVDSIRRILAISKGHAFVLFTAFSALNHAYRQLEDELRAAGITPLCQGKATRTQLLEEFRRDTTSVLFATDSFWEGVDVAGEALQCVILPKLPFRVPTEPIHEARAEAIQAAGGNPFMEYSVPLAVIKFRQGFGRLIRRRTDWGAVVILDKRLVTKYYGKVFLDSLPRVPVVRRPQMEMFQTLEEFFNQRRKER